MLSLPKLWCRVPFPTTLRGTQLLLLSHELSSPRTLVVESISDTSSSAAYRIPQNPGRCSNRILYLCMRLEAQQGRKQPNCRCRSSKQGLPESHFLCAKACRRSNDIPPPLYISISEASIAETVSRPRWLSLPSLGLPSSSSSSSSSSPSSTSSSFFSSPSLLLSSSSSGVPPRQYPTTASTEQLYPNQPTLRPT